MSSMCIYRDCFSNRNSNVKLTFFGLPNDERKKIWLKNCANLFVDLSSSSRRVVCEKHFDAVDIKLFGRRKILQKTAVPRPYEVQGPAIKKMRRQTMSAPRKSKLKRNTNEFERQIDVSLDNEESGYDRNSNKEQYVYRNLFDKSNAICSTATNIVESTSTKSNDTTQTPLPIIGTATSFSSDVSVTNTQQSMLTVAAQGASTTNVLQPISNVVASMSNRGSSKAPRPIINVIESTRGAVTRRFSSHSTKKKQLHPNNKATISTNENTPDITIVSPPKVTPANNTILPTGDISNTTTSMNVSSLIMDTINGEDTTPIIKTEIEITENDDLWTTTMNPATTTNSASNTIGTVPMTQEYGCQTDLTTSISHVEEADNEDRHYVLALLTYFQGLDERKKAKAKVRILQYLTDLKYNNE